MPTKFILTLLRRCSKAFCIFAWRFSSSIHPQERVFPVVREIYFTTVSFPQSQRHLHIDCLVPLGASVLPTRSRATNRPKRCPDISINRCAWLHSWHDFVFPIWSALEMNVLEQRGHKTLYTRLRLTRPTSSRTLTPLYVSPILISLTFISGYFVGCRHKKRCHLRCSKMIDPERLNLTQ